MQVKLEIIKVIIIKDSSFDKVIFNTNLPPATPFDKVGQFMMFIPYDEGENYIKRHFPDVEIEVISRRHS